jgi:hypothetical protein
VCKGKHLILNHKPF